MLAREINSEAPCVPPTPSPGTPISFSFPTPDSECYKRRKPATGSIWKSDLLAHPLRNRWSCLSLAPEACPLPGKAASGPRGRAALREATQALEQPPGARLESWARHLPTGTRLCASSPHLAWGHFRWASSRAGLSVPSTAPESPGMRQGLRSAQVCSGITNDGCCVGSGLQHNLICWLSGGITPLPFLLPFFLLSLWQCLPEVASFKLMNDTCFWCSFPPKS